MEDKAFNVRDLRNGDWFWINKFLLEDERLTASDKVVYGALAYLSNQNQKCFPSFNKIAELATVHPDTVRLSIKKLEFFKYIKVIRKKGIRNCYILLKIIKSKVIIDTTRNFRVPENNILPKLPELPENNGQDYPKIMGTINTNNQKINITYRASPDLNELSLKSNEDSLKQRNWAYSLISWWENEHHLRFADKGKQLGALGRLKKNNYTEEQIKQCYKKMKQNEFWKNKTVDFVNIASNIHKFIKKEILNPHLYGSALKRRTNQ